MKTNIYICQLSNETQNEIKRDVETFLKNEGFTDAERVEIIETAMSGRLVDLEENLNISKYINK